MINDFLAFLEGRPLEGSELQHFQKTGKSGSEKYIAVFDSDMNPLPDFAESIVQIMEKNEKIAFVQTPQYYTNFETNRVARAAGLQQVVFYEYICEGKSLQDAMICCGTNVMFRRKALVEAGGFDDTSVTEDFGLPSNSTALVGALSISIESVPLVWGRKTLAVISSNSFAGRLAPLASLDRSSGK
jgi:cellulose synthase (UDP-forming)